MPPGFSRMDVGDMALDKRNRDAEESIPNHDTGVREAGWIEDDGIDTLLSRRLDAVDDGSFMVGLECRDLQTELGTSVLQSRVDLRKCDAAVDLRFPRSQKIEIGTVDDLCARKLLLLCRCCKSGS